MSKSLDSFFPDIVFHVNTCPEQMVRNEIRNAAREFFDRTLSYRVWLDKFACLANVDEYDIEVPDGTALVKVLELWYDGVRYDPVTNIDAGDEDDNYRTAPGKFKHWTTQNITTLVLLPVPDTTLANAIELFVAVKPASDATTVPDWVVEEHNNDISHGALARLMSYAEKAWTNLELAAFHKAEFEKAIASEAHRAARGRTRAPLRTRAYYSLPR